MNGGTVQLSAADRQLRELVGDGLQMSLLLVRDLAWITFDEYGSVIQANDPAAFAKSLLIRVELRKMSARETRHCGDCEHFSGMVSWSERGHCEQHGLRASGRSAIAVECRSFEQREVLY